MGKVSSYPGVGLHVLRGSSLPWYMSEEGRGSPRGWQRGWEVLPAGAELGTRWVEGSEWGRRWVSADKTRAAPAAGIRGVSMGTDRGCSEGSSSSAGLTCWPWRVRPGIKHRWRVPFGVCRGWAEGPCRAPETARSRRRPARRPRPCSEWVSGGACNTGSGVAAHRLARCLLPLGFAGAEPRA